MGECDSYYGRVCVCLCVRDLVNQSKRKVIRLSVKNLISICKKRNNTWKWLAQMAL